MLYLLLHSLALTLLVSFQIALAACLPTFTLPEHTCLSMASFLKNVKNVLPGQMMLHLA